MNVQVVTDPAGRLLWISPAPPSRAHDLTAARTHLGSVTTHLADFAQAITVSLPEVRAAHSDRGDDFG